MLPITQEIMEKSSSDDESVEDDVDEECNEVQNKSVEVETLHKTETCMKRGKVENPIEACECCIKICFFCIS